CNGADGAVPAARQIQHLVTHCSRYCRDTRLARICGPLETELHRLPRLNSAVPAHVACAVGVAATEAGIPAACHPRAIGIAPADIPAIDRAGAAVGNPDSTGKTAAPLIGHHISATAGGRT